VKSSSANEAGDEVGKNGMWHQQHNADHASMLLPIERRVIVPNVATKYHRYLQRNLSDR
jgi:hypothetical protein